MAETIKRRDIAEEDLYLDVRESAQETIDVTKNLNTELLENARIIKVEVKKSVTESSKTLRAFIKLTEKANKAKKKAIVLDNQQATAVKQKNNAEIQLERIKREKLKTQAQEIRNAAQLRTQQDKQAKAQARVAKSALDEANAYKKLVKRTREQKNESKKLAAQMIILAQGGRKNRAELSKLTVEYRQVTAAARKGDKVLKKIDATVGDNFRNVGNYAKSLGGLRSGLLRLGAALGVFRALRGIGDIVANFDQSQADLLAISGKTETQLKSLTAQAKELGAVTQFSATEITQMQIELAKLGFEVQDIKKSTEAISNFAAATGAAIPDAAKLAGSAMRAFGLEAEEMERVVSTLGVATTKSALDFEALNTGLSTVAPVANAFGFSIEDTTALLGGLSNAGFDASSSATATRNILLNLADANGKLAKELGRPINNLDDLTGGLKELQEKGIDLGEALELTDKRSVAAFETFLKGGDSLVKLRDGITDANDELQAMADKRLDTISGQFTLLKSAWEGFILAANEGSGVGAGIKGLLSFLAGNLPAVIGLIASLGAMFLTYKARLLAVNTAQKLFNSGSGKMVVSLKNMIANLKSGSDESKKLGSTLRGIGWTAIIAGAAALAFKLYDIASGAAQAREDAAKFQRQVENATKSVEKILEKRATKLNEVTAELERQRIIEAENAKTNNAKNEVEKKYLKLKNEAVQAAKNDLSTAKKQVLERKKGYKDELLSLEVIGIAYRRRGKLDDEQLKKANKLGIFYTQATKDGQRQVFNQTKLNRLISSQEAAIKGTNVRLNEYGREINQINETGKDINAEIKVQDLKIKSAGKSIKENNTNFKSQLNLIREINGETEDQITLQNRLNEITNNREISSIQERINEEIELQKIQAGEKGDFDITKTEELTAERLSLEIKAIEDRAEFERLKAIESNGERFRDMRESLKAERAQLLAQDNITADERAQIEANFQAELQKIKLLEVDAAITLEDQIKVIKSEANEEIIDLTKQTAEELADIQSGLIDEVAAQQEKQAAKNLELINAEIEAAKKAAARRRQIAQALADYLTKKSDEAIAQIDKEIAAAEKKQDFLKDLAAKGNIEASQSLAENQRIINEANKKKAAEEKRKQRIQLANTVYQTYTANVESGSESPLGDTIRDISLLQAFINSLPAFESGTENTGAKGQGLDGKGGFLAINHPHERIMDAPNNAKVPAGMSNDELAQLAQDYDTGKLMAKGEGASQIGGAWQTAAIVDKLTSVENAIQEMPDFTVELEKLTDSVAYLMTKRRSGNNIVINKRRLDS